MDMYYDIVCLIGRLDSNAPRFDLDKNSMSYSKKTWTYIINVRDTQSFSPFNNLSLYKREKTS